ncbi:MAG TPA: helix-turn-helix transcriptional regulator [Thermoanaerobaculia bacterium]
MAEEAQELREFMDQLRLEPGYWKHFTIIQFTTAMARLMNKAPRVSGKKLAGLLGVKPSSVSRALSGGENLTIETMIKIAGALDAAVHIHVAKKGLLVRWIEEPASDSMRATIMLGGSGQNEITATQDYEIPEGRILPFKAGIGGSADRSRITTTKAAR